MDPPSQWHLVISFVTIWDFSFAWNPFEDPKDEHHHVAPNMDLNSFMNQLDDFDLTLFEQKVENLRSPTWIEDIGKTRKKATKFSQAMELRNMIVEKTKEILSVGSIALSEEVALSFATSIFNNTLNVGHAGGQKDLTNAPLLIDIGCNGALPLTCRPEEKYRSISGICNNLRYPLWGAASHQFKRLIPPHYADGRGVPRGGLDPEDLHCWPEAQASRSEECGPCTSDPSIKLPNPMIVSSEIHAQANPRPDPIRTNAVTQFGQFLSHDLTLTAESEVEEGCCNRSHPGKPNPNCFPLNVPCTKTCIEFQRSVPFCGSTSLVQEQINGVTGYIDASNVYGSTVDESLLLRTGFGGLLKTSQFDLLPFINGSYRSGDVRNNEMPALASMHTIWVREHNRIAETLTSLAMKSKDNKSDNHIFQEARRIVIAEMQNVVIQEWLPMILGPYFLDQYKLTLSPDQFTTYDDSIQANIFNEVATAAFRFGHSMITNKIHLFKPQDPEEAIGFFRTFKGFFNQHLYDGRSGERMAQLLTGVQMFPAESVDPFCVEDVRKYLKVSESGQRQDLIARNIQRGRDHGIPPYNEFRVLFGLARTCSWNKAPNEIPEDLWRKLGTVYTHPADIDLFTGGLSETPSRGSVFGETFSGLMASQMRDLIYGDRFFFTHGPSTNENTFDRDQIRNIMTRRLGDILCDNIDVLKEIRENVFELDSPINSCDQKHLLDLKIFLK